MKVRLFTEVRSSPRFSESKLSKVICRVVGEEGKRADHINIVLVSDDFLLRMNRRYLNHNYRTDVIAFDLGESEKIEGEIYVSVDRARAQAKRFGVNLKEELLRLIIHGTLHLTGWDDDTRSKKLRMRKRENEFIRLFYVTRTRR